MPLFNPSQAVIHPGYVSGKKYPTIQGALNIGTAIPSANVIYLYPFELPNDINFIKGMVRCQTAGSGSSMKCALWANDPDTMLPVGEPLFVDNTGIATTSSTTDLDITALAGTLYAQTIYWFGAKFTGTLPTMWGLSGANTEAHWLTGIPSGGSLNSNCYQFSDAYANSMPTFASNAAVSGTTQSTPVPHLWLAT